MAHPVVKRSLQQLPFILDDDPIMPKVVGVKGVAHLMGEIGC